MLFMQFVNAWHGDESVETFKPVKPVANCRKVIMLDASIRRQCRVGETGNISNRCMAAGQPIIVLKLLFCQMALKLSQITPVCAIQTSMAAVSV